MSRTASLIGKKHKNRTEFEGESFDGFSLSNMCLIGLKFEKCSFRRTDFSGSDLSYSSFVNCDFYEANFFKSCLYTSRFTDCDLTKANFHYALLNGIRANNANITHTQFGAELETGLNRKRSTVYSPAEATWRCDCFDIIPLISNLESDYKGISCETTSISIFFSHEEQPEKWRISRRKSEVAKTIEMLLYDNGYSEASDYYSYLSRYFVTRSRPDSLSKLIDIILREKISGYGVRLSNPLFSWIFMVILFSFIYPLLPLIFSNSGLEIKEDIFIRFGQSFSNSLLSFFEALEYSIKVSCLSLYDNPKAVGVARIFSILQTVASVALVGVGISIIARKSGVH